MSPTNVLPKSVVRTEYCTDGQIIDKTNQQRPIHCLTQGCEYPIILIAEKIFTAGLKAPQ